MRCHKIIKLLPLCFVKRVPRYLNFGFTGIGPKDTASQFWHVILKNYLIQIAMVLV